MFPAIARGIALFLGAFCLLNLAGDLRFANANANLWWIELPALPVLALGIAMLAWGIVPDASRPRRVITIALLAMGTIAAMVSAVRYYAILGHGVSTRIPLPLSLFVAAALVMIIVAHRYESQRRPFVVAATFVATSIAFPVAQIALFGVTDYRRPADAIVVFGARTYADGTMSSSLTDRVRTGCELYRDGLAPRIIFSGGRGDGAIHETEAMRAFALRHGVPAQAITRDPLGINTESTVRNTARGNGRILAVSHFYHLPRIKMTYQRYGAEVYTVPADASSLRPLAYNVARESVAFWAYYLRRLRYDVSSRA